MLLGLTAAPYLVWLLWGRPDLERLGSFWFYRDFSQYLAAMQEGARSSSWLVHDHFTAEPHQPILMYPLYVGLGKLATALRLELLAVYYLAEVLGRVALLGALYQFGALFLRVGGWRLVGGSTLQPPTS
ncbi:MAG: hypothetical protein HY690_18355, partial [Chloroflexi bacterium]|nr:hypothetical protein [Chloroflexota bacterium]